MAIPTLDSRPVRAGRLVEGVMGKPSRRLVAVLASAVLLATVGASTVAASPPDGACPPSFVEATYEEMFETFPEVPERFGADVMLAILIGFDNNANGVVCWIRHPSVSRVYERDTFVANVIDDNAAPH
jgi:hypothetical protein